jgi:diguanylate cyclase (GGDEF)-like protein
MQDILQILLVEDNPGDVRIIKEIFKDIKSMNVELTNVSTLADAQEKISKIKLDLVLLDLSLPDGYKLEGVKRICTMYPNIPVIVLTGLRDEQISIDAIKIGAQDYMIKDQIDEYILAKAIRYAIERKKMDLKFQHLASHDFLTNLPNRNCLIEQVELSIERTNRRMGIDPNAKVVFILFDLNGFKTINDTYGHLIGDLLLIQIAERLKTSIRMIDTVARLGGDEFGVLFEITQGELNTIFTIKEKINNVFT